MVLYQDIRNVLPAVQVPTLVPHRKGDRFVALDQGRWYAEHIAGARFVELPGDAHFTGAGYVEEIEEFVTGHRGRGSRDSPARAIEAGRAIRDGSQALGISSFSFVDRGSHELKGVPDAWQLYAVT